MTFTITVEPSGRAFTSEAGEAMLAAGIRQGIGLPYGCKDGACGSCKCKLVSGSVTHGPHQAKALSAEEEAAGFVLTCCATPQTDCVVEARTVPGAGEFPVQKMPARVNRIERVAPDVAILRLQRDVGSNSRLGVVYTDKVDGDDWNRVLGVDGGMGGSLGTRRSGDSSATYLRSRAPAAGQHLWSAVFWWALTNS